MTGSNETVGARQAFDKDVCYRAQVHPLPQVHVRPQRHPARRVWLVWLVLFFDISILLIGRPHCRPSKR
jgi:hypothetical protein